MLQTIEHCLKEVNLLYRICLHSPQALRTFNFMIVSGNFGKIRLFNPATILWETHHVINGLFWFW